MKTFEFEGKSYKEAQRTNFCDGCIFKEADVESCKRVEKFASQAFDGGCLKGDVIFVLAEDKPTPADIARRIGEEAIANKIADALENM